MFNIRRTRSLSIQHLIKILAYNLFVYEQVSAQQQQQQKRCVPARDQDFRPCCVLKRRF